MYYSLLHQQSFQLILAKKQTTACTNYSMIYNHLHLHYDIPVGQWIE